MRVEIQRTNSHLCKLFGEEYSAYWDGNFGWGRTEEAAINNLKKKLKKKIEDNYTKEVDLLEA